MVLISDYSLASFMHHILVLSPEGQYLLKLVDNVHKLFPYSMIKQTLRIGNAATMISGMMRLLLTKIGVGALTNWVGWTQNAADGMNLLQRIVSLVLSWDSSEFRKSGESIEKTKGGPSKEHISVIKQYIDMSRDEHEALRAVSKETPESIVAAIFANLRPDLLASLSEAQHAQCLEYYSASLSVRDREQITKVLCRQSPDLFTQALRDLVGSFEPIIRAVHERVDIRDHLAAAESFINDFIATSKPKKAPNEAKNSELPDIAPSVEDYVGLLRRNRQLLYNWLHQFAANCPDVRDSFRSWAKSTIKKAFKQHQEEPEVPLSHAPESSTPPDRDGLSQPKQRLTGAGDMSPALQNIFRNLPADAQAEVLPALDAHAAYLSALEDLSASRMQRILDNLANTDHASSSASPSPDGRAAKKPSGRTTSSSSSVCGPGMFLSRWQALLDGTAVTPAARAGAPVRRGGEVKGSSAQGKTGASGLGDGWDSDALARRAGADVPEPPEVDVVVRALGPAFRGLAVGLAGVGGMP